MAAGGEYSGAASLSGVSARPSGVVDSSSLLSPNIAAVMVAAIVYMGLVANSEVAALLAQGRRLDLTGSTASGWQYAREGLTVVLTVALLLGISRGRVPKVAVPTFLVALYVAFQVARVLVDANIPETYALLGLRFVYLAFIVTALAWYDAVQRDQLLRRLSLLLLPMLAIETVIAVRQILTGPAVLGTTALGSRPWGTYASSNNLGLAVLGFALIFVLGRFKGRWPIVLLCGALCVTTGSRTAILGFLLLLAGLAVMRNRYRLLFVPAALVIFLLVYTAISSQAVSGRDIDGEARWDVWRDGLSYLGGPFEVIFGKGLGVGSNAATVLYGKGAIVDAGPAVVDSTVVWVILSMGLIGLAIFVAAFAIVIKRMGFERRFVVLPTVLICALTFNLPELSPINLLAAVAVGVSLSHPVDSRRELPQA